MMMDEDDDIVLTGSDLIAYVSKLRRYVKMLEEGLAGEIEDDADEIERVQAATIPSIAAGVDGTSTDAAPRTSGKSKPESNGKTKSSGKPTEAKPRESTDGTLARPAASETHQGARTSTARQAKPLRECVVAVVGLGRIGARVCELLARSGVGGFILIDKATVAARHLESSPYTWEHVGLPKTQAVRLLLQAINANVKLRSEVLDVDSSQNVLRSLLAQGRKADLFIACLDSFPARRVMNNLALELNVSLFNAQLGLDASGGIINFVRPGRTACLQCRAAKEMASSVQVRRTQLMSFKDNDDNVRPAKHDLPGVALLFAGLVAQNAAKVLRMDGIVLPTFKFALDADVHMAQATPASIARETSDAAKAEDAPAATTTEPSREFKSFGAEPYAQCTNEDCVQRQLA